MIDVKLSLRIIILGAWTTLLKFNNSAAGRSNFDLGASV